MFTAALGCLFVWVVFFKTNLFLTLVTCVELIKCKAVNLLLGSNGTIQRKSLMLTDHQGQGEHC